MEERNHMNWLFYKCLEEIVNHPSSYTIFQVSIVPENCEDRYILFQDNKSGRVFKIGFDKVFSGDYKVYIGLPYGNKTEKLLDVEFCNSASVPSIFSNLLNFR